MTQEFHFRKSTHSAQGQECVEAALRPAWAAVRDTKHREAGHLVFPAREWAAFLHALKDRRL